MITRPTVEEVAERLHRWIRERFGDGAELAGPPEVVTGGLDTYIYRFQPTEGGPLILRLYPSVSRGPSAEREAAVLGFLHGVGYPAPAPVDHGTGSEAFGLPYVVMEQVAGATVLDRVKARPRQTGSLLDSLAAAQASLHGLDRGGWPFPPADGPEIDRRLAAVEGAASPAHSGLAHALRWLQDHRGVVRREDPAVCHNDFHPLNALVDDDGRLAVIDWENASLGDRHSDLARSLVLFEWAPAVAGSAVERVVLRAAKPWIVKRYRAAYERHLAIEEERLHYWLAFHAADSWWEASTLLEGTFERDTRTDERLGPAAVVAPARARLFARLVPDA